MSLFAAINSDDLDSFNKLLTNDAVLRERDELGCTALHACANVSNVAMMAALVPRFKALGLNIDDAGNSTFRIVSNYRRERDL